MIVINKRINMSFKEGMMTAPDASSEQLSEKDLFVNALGSDLHDDWRENRKNDDGTYEPRIKVYGEDDQGNGKWFNDEVGEGYTEIKRQDIANTNFAELDPDWQIDNAEAAEIVADIIFDAMDAGMSAQELLDGENLEAASKQIHDEFLKRRKERGAWISEDQDRPYEELTEEEKEKDRAQVRKGIEKYKSM